MVQPRLGVRDFRRIAVSACVLLVTLRLFIGWQFLYEGVWKLETQSSTRPWTAAGFLKSAQGPLRGAFRAMNGDPDDMNWLSAQWVEGHWDQWAAHFTQFYNLSDGQRARLNDLLNGPAEFRVRLNALPTNVKFPADYNDILRFDPKLQAIVVDGKKHLSAAEKDALLSYVVLPEQVSDENRADWELGQAYKQAIERAYNLASRLSYKERLAVALGGSDPNRVRFVFSNFKGSLGTEAPEKIDHLYQNLLAEYQAANKRATLPFEKEHLARQWEELQQLRKELVNPVIALDKTLHDDAIALLTPEQISKGAPPAEWTQQRIVDWMTMIGLTALGLLLIMGLASRAAAIGGAVMVLSFYLVWPPWPGVMADTGPEHALIVNKNLIEVVALLAIAAMPTGQWFGVDSLIYRGWAALRSRRRVPKAAPLDRKKSSAVAVH